MATERVVRELIVRVKDDSAQLSSGLGKVRGELTATGAAWKAAAAGAVALGVAAVAGMAKAVDTTVRLAGEVRSLSKQLGISAEEASKLRVVGANLGIGTDQLTRSFGFFQRNLVNNTASFRAYGISLTDAAGQQKTFTQLLGEAADKYKALGAGTYGTAFAMNVFGRSGRDLIPILALGSAGIAKMGDEAKKAGLIFSQQALDADRQLGIETQKLGEAFQGLGVSIGQELVPFVTKATEAITRAVEWITKLPAPIKMTALAVTVLTGALAGLGLLVGVVRKGLGNLTAIFGSNAAAAAADAAATTAAADALVLYEASAGGTVVATHLVAAASTEAAAATTEAAVATGALGTAAEGVAGGLASGAAGIGLMALAIKGLIDDSHKGSAALLENWHQGVLTARGYYRLADAANSAAQAANVEASALGDEALAHRGDAVAALAQRDAELSLEGGILGILGASASATDALHQLKAAHHAAAAAASKYGTDSKQYRDALAQVKSLSLQGVQSQLSLQQAVESYANTLEGPVNKAYKDLQDAMAGTGPFAKDLTGAQQKYNAALAAMGPSQQDAIDKLRALGKSAGASAGFVQGLIDQLLALTSKVPGMPNMSIGISVGFGRGYSPQAAGAVFKAAEGITRGPTLMVGEGSYSTPFGTGNELVSGAGIMPLSSSHIMAIGAAIKKAMGGAGGGSGRSVTVVLHFHGDVYTTNSDELARNLAPALKRELERMDVLETG
jgi:hypothetical protein